MTATGATPAVAAGFTHLALTQFRNYRHLALDLELRPVVLVGANGAGKTNLLEALSLLGPGSGLNRAKLSEIDFRGPGNQANMAWAVHAKLQTAGEEFALGTGRDPMAQAQIGRDRRLARINGAPARSQADFADILSVQWLVPAMDGLFDDAASARRRYLDRLVTGIDPGHAARVAAYDTAMRERARLLRGEVGATQADLDAWLDALEAEMAGAAVAIAASRCEAVDALNVALGESEGPFPRASLAAAGAVETWLGEGPALAAEDRLKAQPQGRARERCRLGRHRMGHPSQRPRGDLSRPRPRQRAAARRRMLDRRAAGAAAVDRAGGGAPDQAPPRPGADPAAGRGGVASGRPAARSPVRRDPGARPAGLADRDGPRAVPPARRPGAVFRGRGWPRPQSLEIPAFFSR